MILLPAIDIKEGKVVRLLQGRFDLVTEYSRDPVQMAMHWKSKGAQWVHVVDLDGAKTGQMANFEIIKTIISTIGIPVQVGGGVRTMEGIQSLMDAGAARVVLGTIAFEDEKLLKAALSKFSEKIAVSLDCVDDDIMKNGWVKSANVSIADFSWRLKSLGLKHLIYTDIAKDGMLSNPNWNMLRYLLSNISGISLIVSGGVSSLEDVVTLSQMSEDENFKGKLFGAITGKAIYEGKIDFEKAVRICSINV